MNKFKNIRKENIDNSIKYGELIKRYGRDDILPMWIADMDYKVCEEIQAAIIKRAEIGIFGYTHTSDDYYNYFIKWVDKKYQLKLSKEEILFNHGVVFSIIECIRAFTEEGDKIIIQTPVYGPFHTSVKDHNRVLLRNKLKFEDGRYTMDFDDLRQKIDEGAKMLILCSPHNPVGRVWTKEELKMLSEIIIEKDIYVLSDEIHSDLILHGEHTPFITVDKRLEDKVITFMAPSKTFNLAGLQSSVILIKNEKLKKKLTRELETMDVFANNCFGEVAFTEAYKSGEPYLLELLDHFRELMDFAVSYIRKNIPKVSTYIPEGTYLLWLDFRELGLKGNELEDFVYNECKVALTPGTFFGYEGDGFMRMNMATSKEMVHEALLRIEKAVKGR